MRTITPEESRTVACKTCGAAIGEFCKTLNGKPVNHSHAPRWDEIKNNRHNEDELIRRGLDDREVRALVKVIGALSRLPTEQAKQRTMQFVLDYFAGKDG